MFARAAAASLRAAPLRAAPLRAAATAAAARAPSTSLLRTAGFSSTAAAMHHIARVQHPAPAWSARAVVNKQFVNLSSQDFAGKWLVLFFYPLDFTFVCPTEIIAFSERIEEFRKLNAEVVGASIDSVHSHLAWINMPRKEGGLGHMNIPLISDVTKNIAHEYGVLVDSGKDIGLALRGTFIIDPKGIVRQITINDTPVGRSVDETLRLVEALQFADEHGEVCPAGWKKGQKSMVADPVKSKDYFRSVNDN